MKKFRLLSRYYSTDISNAYKEVVESMKKSFLI